MKVLKQQDQDNYLSSNFITYKEILRPTPKIYFDFVLITCPYNHSPLIYDQTLQIHIIMQHQAP